jgi:hypothetical protein
MQPVAVHCLVDYATWQLLGDSLLSVPRATLHNGAIDCATAALSNICSYCLNRCVSSGGLKVCVLLILVLSNHISLLDLPTQWLSDPMSRALSGEAPTVRRSSAVTFAIAAVLEAEPARSNRPLLSRTLKALFDTAVVNCGTGSSRTNASRIRVHSLNCLRLLFNSSALGAQMLQFVEQGLLCAFSGFRCAVTVYVLDLSAASSSLIVAQVIIMVSEKQFHPAVFLPGHACSRRKLQPQHCVPG